MTPKKSILILISLFLLQSCTKEIDFNQVDDVTIHSTYIFPLVHLSFGAIKFLDELNQEISYTTDIVAAPLTKEFEPYLEKVEFNIVTTNTFNREFKLNIIFFDAQSNPIYTLQPTIIAPPNSSEVATLIEIPNEDIPVVFNTIYYGFSMQLSPSTDGSSISPSDISKLDLKSSVKLFFNFKKV